MSTETMWEKVLSRDAAADGRFVYAVRSTHIYCRPTCPSKRPHRDQVEFFASPNDAEQKGYRAAAAALLKLSRAPTTSPASAAS